MTENNKYERLLRELREKGVGSMKCFGSSMTPILTSGTINLYRRQDDYRIGDIVFCKVRGRWIDAHLITAKAPDGRYLISNNHGHDNGWTRAVFGRVIKATAPNGTERRFRNDDPEQAD
jgi:hypothetical protein